MKTSFRFSFSDLNERTFYDAEYTISKELKINRFSDTIRQDCIPEGMRFPFIPTSAKDAEILKAFKEMQAHVPDVWEAFYNKARFEDILKGLSDLYDIEDASKNPDFNKFAFREETMPSMTDFWDGNYPKQEWLEHEPFLRMIRDFPDCLTQRKFERRLIAILKEARYGFPEKRKKYIKLLKDNLIPANRGGKYTIPQSSLLLTYDLCLKLTNHLSKLCKNKLANKSKTKQEIRDTLDNDLYEMIIKSEFQTDERISNLNPLQLKELLLAPKEFTLNVLANHIGCGSETLKKRLRQKKTEN